MKQDIQPAELRRRIEAGEKFRLVDVRTAHEFAQGHIPGAINIPLHTIEVDLPGIGSEETIVVVCQKGARSLVACEKIERHYSNLWNLMGGTNAWLVAGLEVEALPKDPTSLTRQTHLVAGIILVVGFGLYRLVDPNWIYLVLLPAFGLLLDAFTGICPMTQILKRMPWNAAHVENL